MMIRKIVIWLLVIGTVYLSYTLVIKFEPKPKESPMIIKLYNVKWQYVDKKREILIKKQDIDSELKFINDKINEVDNQIKEAVNSGLDFQ